MKRGYTLIELVTYLGLLGSAMVMVGSAEIAMGRVVRFQGALVESFQTQVRLDGQQVGQGLEGALRRDIRAAVAVTSVSKTRLELKLRPVGSQEPVSCVWRFENGSLWRNDAMIAAKVADWAWSRDADALHWKARLEVGGGASRVERHLEGAAVPRVSR